MDFFSRMNQFGAERLPFLFIIDFEMNKPLILPLSLVNEERVWYDIEGNCNVEGNEFVGNKSESDAGDAESGAGLNRNHSGASISGANHAGQNSGASISDTNHAGNHSDNSEKDASQSKPLAGDSKPDRSANDSYPGTFDGDATTNVSHTGDAGTLEDSDPESGKEPSGTKTQQDSESNQKAFPFEIKPVGFETYKKAFDRVVKNIHYGNSFLVNLTFPTEIKTNIGLKDIFLRSKAKYKLFFDDQFVVFSPEIFVEIVEGKIYSYPMKGTIDAGIPNAREIILNDSKEQAEHATITDLIRNDLSRVASNVRVDKYRYIDTLKTNQKDLLQVSSKISGVLPEDYHSQLGDIFLELLPAGSISGAPKTKTLEIIRNAEGQARGYFTGVFGIYDGENLKSAVMIRYIEQTGKKLFFRSGGGITASSNLDKEYEEMINKVYVPVY